MKIYTVYDTVKKLIGPILPVGETTADDKRFENLKETIGLMEALLSDIGQVAEKAGSQEHSVKRAGECAREFLWDIKEGGTHAL